MVLSNVEPWAKIHSLPLVFFNSIERIPQFVLTYGTTNTAASNLVKHEDTENKYYVIPLTP